MTKTTAIVAALADMKGMKFEEMIARTAELFPDAGDEQIERAFAIAADDAREQGRRDMAEAEWLNSVAPLFDGLPEGTTLERAAAIKAAQGDPLAARVLVQLASPAYRLQAAISEAAMTADPANWRETEDGGWLWLGEGEMPDGNQMIEQFQINHPAEARRIEEEITGKA